MNIIQALTFDADSVFSKRLTIYSGLSLLCRGLTYEFCSFLLLEGRQTPQSNIKDVNTAKTRSTSSFAIGILFKDFPA